MKTIGIIANTQKPMAAETIKRLMQMLGKRGADVRLETETAGLVTRKKGAGSIPQVARGADLLIVLGGDGTLLRVARELDGMMTPILGVNLGSLGFLSCTPLEDAEAAVRAVLKGDYTVSKRTTLHTRLLRGQKTVKESHALNDVVVSRGEVSRVARIEVSIDDHFVAEYVADGIIFATPTGSTAYSLSAEGPILNPETAVFAITPICPHPISYRPLVVPHECVVTARPVNPAVNPLLTVDGQVQTEMHEGDVVEVSGGKQFVQLVMLKRRSYYDVLREKLKWSDVKTGPKGTK